MLKKRVILYVHDGSGIGHLQIIARIASALQKSFSTLIITGHRCASWIVPPQCEFVYLPCWDNLTSEKASYWGRVPWLNLSLAEAISLKGQMFSSIVKAYKPDAIFVDNLPFGKYNEIEECITSYVGHKYFLHRGVVGIGDKDILCGQASKLYSNIYNRMFIAADRRVLDFVTEYNLDAALASKIIYVGYITPEKKMFPNRDKIRALKDIKNNEHWVVCSSGGGMKAENFLNKCIESAAFFPKVKFDIVFGPRSKNELREYRYLPSNVKISKQAEDLPEMHSACDVAIINGGYNSLMEAFIGGTYIIIYPNQINQMDEQVINANNFKKYYPVSLLEKPSSLRQLLSTQLEIVKVEPRPIFSLDTNGAENIVKIIEMDMLLRL